MPLVGFSFYPFTDRSSLADQPLLDALQLAIPNSAIDDAIALTGTREKRCRLLPSRLIICLVIALSLWSRDAARQVFANLVDGIKEQKPMFADLPIPTKGAITRARQRLGPRPLIVLFRALAKPIATPETPGAFLGGLRLMALDGTMLTIPDTPDIERIFGRRGGGRGKGAYPQLRLVSLIEVGTHLQCDAVIRPCLGGEHEPAQQLLRSVGQGMLLMWDSGLHSYRMIAKTLATGAHFLGRVGKSMILVPVEQFSDGSYSAYIYPTATARRRGEQGILVRVIKYTIDDPARTGHGKLHRLITSLFDIDTFPASLLAPEYHQRWEIETTIDEIKVHQEGERPVHLRSQKPREVVQELFGLLVAHLAIRTVMFHAAGRVEVDPDRLSFVNTLRIIRRAVPKFQRAQPEQTPFLSTDC